MAPEAQRNAFTTWLVSICFLLTVVSAVTSKNNLKLTEDELKAYDGTDAEKGIFLSINGTIFDVSASPAFYGPGGHYHHFTGKDASRAWVSECWDSTDQLTWRMDGLEAMYMPKYLDEQMQQAADGESDIEGADAFGQAEMARMAKVVMGKFGKVTEQDRKKRRITDQKEAEDSVHDRLAHWIDFFAKNDKYTVVGSVIFDKDKPAPPDLCEEALKKRPLKGGLLDDMMKRAGGMGGVFGGEKKPPVAYDAMPDFVQDALKKGKGTPQAEQDEIDDDEDLVRDEL